MNQATLRYRRVSVFAERATCAALLGLCFAASLIGCSASPPPAIRGHCEPSSEVCDGRDNNCNGRVDEDLGVITCGIGECFNEVSTCNAGKLNRCLPRPSHHEVCSNNLDDDVVKEKQLVPVTKPYGISTISASSTGADFAVAWAGLVCTPAYFLRFNPFRSAAASSPVEITEHGVTATNPVAVSLGANYSVFWSSCVTMRRGSMASTEANLAFGIPDIERGMLQHTQLTDHSTYDQVLRADVVWTGSEYGVTFSSGKRKGEGYLLRISKDGRVLSQTLVADHTTVDHSLVVAWHGDGFGLAWTTEQTNGRLLNFMRTDSNGNPIGTPKVVRNIGHPSAMLAGDLRHRPAIAWNGTSYALAWRDFRDSPSAATLSENEAANRACPGCASLDWKRPSSIYFATVSKEGEAIGASVRVASGARLEDPSMVWTGNEYGIAFNRDDGVLFARVRPGGLPHFELLPMLHPPPGVSESLFSTYQLVWSTGSYGLVWISREDGIYFMSFQPGCQYE
jgi:hypothetical protein